MVLTSDRGVAAETPAADYRSAVEQALENGDAVRITREVDSHLEMCAVVAAWRREPVRPLLVFENLRGYPGVRGSFNMFTDAGRLSRALGMPERQASDKLSFLNALRNPLPPVVVPTGPCQENVVTEDIDIGKMFPAIHGASNVTSLYFQPVTIARNPISGEKNTAIYRAAIQGPRQLTVNARWDQHTGLLLSSAKLGAPPTAMPIALCIGAHPAIYIGGVTKMGYGEDELAFAGAVIGQPVELVKCVSIDLEVPATSEIVIEGEIRPPYRLGAEGPWPEYLGYLGMEVHPPIMDITAVTFRNDPIVHYEIPAVTPHLIGMGLQASFFRYLKNMGGGFIVDSLITPVTRLHHAFVKVRKTEDHHEGLQINVALGAFGFLNSIDLVVLLDEDIDIRNLSEVEWAIATRCDPTQQVHILPPGRSQQVNPIVGAKELDDRPFTRGKWIIDATAPWKYRKAEKLPGIGFFSRAEWPSVVLRDYLDNDDARRWLTNE